MNTLHNRPPAKASKSSAGISSPQRIKQASQTVNTRGKTAAELFDNIYDRGRAQHVTRSLPPVNKRRPVKPKPQAGKLQLARRMSDGAVPIPMEALLDPTLTTRDKLFLGNFFRRATTKQHATFTTRAMKIATNSSAAQRQSQFVKQSPILKRISKHLSAPGKLHNRGRLYTLADGIDRLGKIHKPLQNPLSDYPQLGTIYEQVAGKVTKWGFSEVGGRELFVWVKLPAWVSETMDYVRRVLESKFVRTSRERHEQSADCLEVISDPDFEAILAKRRAQAGPDGDEIVDPSRWIRDQRAGFDEVTSRSVKFGRCNRFFHGLVEVCRELRAHVGFDGMRGKIADAHAMHIAELFARFGHPDEMELFADFYRRNFYRSLIDYGKEHYPESCGDLTLRDAKGKALSGAAYERDYHANDDRGTADKLADRALRSQRVQILFRSIFPKTNANVSKIRDHGPLIRRKRRAGKIVDTHLGQQIMSRELTEGEFKLFQAAANTIFEQDGQPALTLHDALFVPESIPDERLIEVIQHHWRTRYPHMPDLIINIEIPEEVC